MGMGAIIGPSPLPIMGPLPSIGIWPLPIMLMGPLPIGDIMPPLCGLFIMPPVSKNRKVPVRGADHHPWPSLVAPVRRSGHARTDGFAVRLSVWSSLSPICPEPIMLMLPLPIGPLS